MKHSIINNTKLQTKIKLMFSTMLDCGACDRVFKHMVI